MRSLVGFLRPNAKLQLKIELPVRSRALKPNKSAEAFVYNWHMQVYRDSLAPLSTLNPTPRPRFRKKSEKKIIKVSNFYEKP